KPRKLFLSPHGLYFSHRTALDRYDDCNIILTLKHHKATTSISSSNIKQLKRKTRTENTNNNSGGATKECQSGVRTCRQGDRKTAEIARQHKSVGFTKPLKLFHTYQHSKQHPNEQRRSKETTGSWHFGNAVEALKCDTLPYSNDTLNSPPAQQLAAYLSSLTKNKIKIRKCPMCLDIVSKAVKWRALKFVGSL
ncbi:unnamed protein product, partial [Ceratitis capitata]